MKNNLKIIGIMLIIVLIAGSCTYMLDVEYKVRYEQTVNAIDVNMLETHYLVNVMTNWSDNYGFVKKEDMDMYTNGRYIYSSIKVMHPYNNGKFVIVPTYKIHSIKGRTIEDAVSNLMR